MKLPTPSATETPIRKLDVRIRMLVLLFLLPGASFFAPYPIMAVLVGAAALLVFLTGVTTFWRVSKLYVAFSVVALPLLSFATQSGPSVQRLLLGFELAIRFNLLVSFGIVFALVTGPNEMLQGMMKLRIPHRWGMLLVLGFRLYPLLLKRARERVEMLRARGFWPTLSIARPGRAWRTILLLGPAIALSALEAGVLLADTMVARGYDPRAPITVAPDIKFRWIDYIVILGAVGIAGASVLT